MSSKAVVHKICSFLFLGVARVLNLEIREEYRKQCLQLENYLIKVKFWKAEYLHMMRGGLKIIRLFNIRQWEKNAFSCCCVQFVVAFLLSSEMCSVPDRNAPVQETNPSPCEPRENKDLYVGCDERSLGGERPRGPVDRARGPPTPSHQDGEVKRGWWDLQPSLVLRRAHNALINISSLS